MAISSVTNRVSYTGNGTTATYAYTFEIRADEDLNVYVRNTTTNVQTTLTLTTDYTVSGEGSSSGGNVVLVDADQAWLDSSGFLKSPYKLYIVRKRSPKQETSVRNQSAFYPEGHELFFDHAMMVAQSQQDEIDRSVKLPASVLTSDFSPTLPSDIGGVIGKVPMTNSTGTGWADADDWPGASSVETSTQVAAHAALTATHGVSGAIVGTSDSQTLTNKTINGSNNTITNVSLTSGVTGVLPSANVSATRTINAQSGTTYTFVLGDAISAGAFPLVTFGSGSATTVTVPPNASVAFPVGAQIDCAQVGAGKVTLAEGSGVTINSLASNKAIAGQYVGVTLVKTATNTWLLTGNLIA